MYLNDLYLKVSVLLLAYVFETLRKESISPFDLDSAHYVFTLDYSWNAMLRFPYINWKLISGIEKYQFIKSTIRGGFAMTCKGSGKANYKFLKSHNANKPTSYIICLHTNNVYWHSMMQLLPTQILDWINPKDFNIDNYSNDSPVGCFLDVDLDYPDKFYDMHNDYLLEGKKKK